MVVCLTANVYSIGDMISGARYSRRMNGAVALGEVIWDSIGSAGCCLGRIRRDDAICDINGVESDVVLSMGAKDARCRLTSSRSNQRAVVITGSASAERGYEWSTGFGRGWSSGAVSSLSHFAGRSTCSLARSGAAVVSSRRGGAEWHTSRNRVERWWWWSVFLQGMYGVVVYGDVQAVVEEAGADRLAWYLGRHE